MPDINALIANQQIGNTGAAAAANRTLDLQATWNSGGTTFQGLFYNVTDTASASGSNLADLQVGSVSKFSVNKAGGILVGGTTYGMTEFGNTRVSSVLLAAGIEIKTGGETKWASTSIVGFSSSTNVQLSADTAWERVSAGVVGFNNGTAGTFRDIKVRQVLITPVAVASLVAAATAGNGARAHVTDALAPSFGATVAGGGAVSTPVYSDGSNWKVG